MRGRSFWLEVRIVDTQKLDGRTTMRPTEKADVVREEVLNAIDPHELDDVRKHLEILCRNVVMGKVEPTNRFEQELFNRRSKLDSIERVKAEAGRYFDELFEDLLIRIHNNCGGSMPAWQDSLHGTARIRRLRLAREMPKTVIEISMSGREQYEVEGRTAIICDVTYGSGTISFKTQWRKAAWNVMRETVKKNTSSRPSLFDPME
jgi:hypothetical protein